MNSLSIAHTKKYFRIFYLIYCSMLGVESIYFEKLYNSISESDFYKNLSDVQQKQIQEIFVNLCNTKLKHSFYYPMYASIKHDNNYNQKEKDFAYNLGVKNFETWKFTFIVLAYRYRNNPHFIGLFEKSEEPFNIHKLSSLESCFAIFDNAYSTWRKDNKNKKR